MKNLIVRLSVLALALTGFSASTIASTHSKTVIASATKPCCWPGTGYCGLD